MWLKASFQIDDRYLGEIKENSVIDLTFVDVRSKKMLKIYFNPQEFNNSGMSLSIRHDDMKVTGKKFNYFT